MKSIKAEVIDKKDLTERESEILVLLCEAEQDKTIARRLNISLSTVQTHTENLYQKMGVRNASINARCAAISAAVARGMVKITSTALCFFLAIGGVSLSEKSPPTFRDNQDRSAVSK